MEPGSSAAPAPPIGRLDEQLCFALYAATNALQRSYAPLLKAAGITYLQYLVLLVLFERDDLTVGQLGARLYLDSGTLTPLLRRLERAGLVARTRRERDEREVHITLTASGRRLESQLSTVGAEMACRVALEPERFAALRDELRTLQARLRP